MDEKKAAEVFDEMKAHSSTKRSGLGFSGNGDEKPSDGPPDSAPAPDTDVASSVKDEGTGEDGAAPGQPQADQFKNNDKFAEAMRKMKEVASRIEAQAGVKRPREDGEGGGDASAAKRHDDGRIREKVFLPVDQHPEIDFHGALVGPGGATQKRMETDSGCRIFVRGKGASKPDSAPDLEVIASKLSTLPLEKEGNRAVVFTQGAEHTILAWRGEVRTFPIIKVPKEQICDFNGAGDSFAGGFMAVLVAESKRNAGTLVLSWELLERCCRGGNLCASAVIRQTGARYPKDVPPLP